jgi:hypothetical protein
VSDYLLDTNHASPLVTLGHPLRQRVLERLEAGDTFAVCVPVVAETVSGIGILPRAAQNRAEWARLQPLLGVIRFHSLMPSRQEKHRRRAIVQAQVDEKWAEAEARMPISKKDLKDLLDMLESTIFERRSDGTIWCYCDETLARTRAFLGSRNLSEADIVAWLHEYGGFCDCEVSANVGDSWADRLDA